ncbi:hypothetical protein HK102_001499 [Quaeritorhiza haematococci]|nr:hypothetical protein HK102_001499 [Quaeritorhiza haematococci]
MSSNNPVVQILFNHPQNAVLAGGDLSTGDSIDVSVENLVDRTTSQPSATPNPSLLPSSAASVKTSDDSFGSTDEQIEISTDSVYDVVSNQPLGPNDLRHILRQPPTRTVTTATRTTKRGGRRYKKRKHR